MNSFLTKLMFFKKGVGQSGRLTFVGVGPGDPNLVTIAAVKAIKKATFVAYPVSKVGAKSIANEIASKYIKNAKSLPIVFPMVEDSELLDNAWGIASNKLVELVDNGENVVLLCLGDPSLYATSSYILQKITSNHRPIPLHVIPGVSSFSAAAAEAKLPLCLKKEELILSSVPESSRHLEQLLDEVVTSKRVLVLMKLGVRWLWVREILKKRNLLHNTLFAKRIGFSDQVIISANEVDSFAAPYFSLLIITIRK